MNVLVPFMKQKMIKGITNTIQKTAFLNDGSFRILATVYMEKNPFIIKSRYEMFMWTSNIHKINWKPIFINQPETNILGIQTSFKGILFFQTEVTISDILILKII